MKISTYKKKSPAKWKTIAISLPDNFIRSTLFAGLRIGITPVAQALAAEGQTNADDTLVVEASTPSLYAPQQSADPKFSRPVADTTRTMTVISEQVIKDQAQPTLPTRSKTSPAWVRFLRVRTVPTTGDAIYMRGADTSNSIYIDGIRDIGSVLRDTFSTEQVEVIKGPSGTDYGRSAPTGSINMISKQPRNDLASTPPPVLAAPGSAAARWTSIRSLVIPPRCA
ncbi:TonB-dependent receptor plug domain-containing protein [Escherichia coli]